MRGNCLAQERARARTRTTLSGDERIDPEATAQITVAEIKQLCFYISPAYCGRVLRKRWWLILRREIIEIKTVNLRFISVRVLTFGSGHSR